MSAFRSSAGSGVDRTRQVGFRFDGRSYTGFAGDTLASALLASGVSLFGRSFKYHRPRGIFAAGVDEPCALVTVTSCGRRDTNLPATMVELFEGLEVESQNRYPSLDHDIGAINQLAGGLIGAGFYYKTFMGPVFGPLQGTRFWMLCERLIRRAAGLGKAGYDRDPSRFEKMNAFCDVLVVGGGPAGLAAARAAAKDGGRVILADLEPRFGGALKWSGETVEDKPGSAWASEVVAELASMPNVRLLPRTNVWGWYDGNTFAAAERVGDHRPATEYAPRQRHWVIRAGRVVLATGALERPIVFPGNDLPGVMLAGAAARFSGEFGVMPGKSIAVFTNNDSAYRHAAALAAAGGRIAIIVDVRPEVSEEARALVRQTGGELLTGHAIVATSGGKTLLGVEARRFDVASATVSSDGRSIKADCLLVSGGWSPTLHLASQAGAQPVWNTRLQAFLPPDLPKGWRAAGAVAGHFSTEAALADGVAAGADTPPAAEPSKAEGIDPAPVFEIRPSGKAPKAFVDLQHDVTAEDVRLAHREGFVSVEHLKRYTTLGMATDQGKTSNVPGLAIMAAARGSTIPETGVTRFRPPYSAVSIGTIAGERYGHLRPERLTPMHDWHVAREAIMQPSGLWFRPQIYGHDGETVEQAYVREARIVREAAGIVDVSTLGKIAVQGPDAGEFLDRVYTNMFSTLPVGKARYGLMLREDGFAYDDGTTWRLGANDFLMTTTTANAGKVMQNLEYFLDVYWPDLRVTLTSVTDQWAGAAVAGPRSRDILAACVTGTAVDNAALPFMGIVHGEIDGAPVMICRLSFSGELAYEVYCGAGHGQQVWDALMTAGAGFGIVPYGLEALGTLRIEKGHVTGAEIDGRTTARDLHLDWMLSKRKPFIGSAMMDRDGMTAAGRLQLVGLVSLDGRPLKGGGHIVAERGDGALGDSLGHITSVCYAPALGKYIALALLADGTKRIGERLRVSDPLRGRFGPVEVVSHHFFDPDGSRMHG